MQEARFTGAGFVKTFVLPAVFAFAVPIVSLLFFTYASAREPEEPQLAWMTLVAGVCLALGSFVILLGLACTVASRISDNAMYVAFRIGWSGVRVAAILEVIGQGVLLVGLSFWVPALFFEKVSLQIIAVWGAVAVAGAAFLIKAIFTHVDDAMTVEGVLLDEPHALPLFDHVRQVCRQLQTPPPFRIIAGVDDNFFVTEAPIMVGGRRHVGRSLFVSLSLLRHLEKEEAGAILAHEMAHFSGNDTFFSKKLSPLLGGYAHVLDAIHGGSVGTPIFYFMSLFWTLSQLSLRRMSREREHRADGIAAKLTSPAAMGRALLKVVAYSSYRARVEESLFSENRVRNELGISSRVSSGFTSYVVSKDLRTDLLGQAFPHPFDTHPPLTERLEAVGAALPPQGYEQLLSAPVQKSWTESIRRADELESGLWQQYERRFAAEHEEALAYRYEPANDEERALVRKYFPDFESADKKGENALWLDHAGIRFSQWPAKIAFSDIARCEVENDVLEIKYLAAAFEYKKAKVDLGKFPESAEVLGLFNVYRSRHDGAQKYKR